MEKAWILVSAQNEARSMNKNNSQRIYSHEQRDDTNMNVTGASCEGSEGNEEYFILKQSKHDSCCIG